MTAANEAARKSSPQTCRELSSPQKQPANVPRVKQPAKAARKRAVSEATWAVGWVGRASINKPAKQTPHQTSDWAHT